MPSFGIPGLNSPLSPEEEREAAWAEFEQRQAGAMQMPPTALNPDTSTALPVTGGPAPVAPARGPLPMPVEPTPVPEGATPSRADAFARQADHFRNVSSAKDTINNFADAFRGKPFQAKDRTEQDRQDWATEQKLREKESLDDPSSPDSIAVRELVKRSMPELAQQMGPYFDRMSYAKATQIFPFLKEELGRIREGNRLQAEQEKAKRLREQQLADGDLEFQRKMKLKSMEGGPDASVALLRDLQIKKLQGELGQQQKGRPLPAGDAAQLGGLVSAQGELKKLHNAFKSDTDWTSTISRFFPNTDAKRFKNKSVVAAQVIGKILEGGKLAEGDLARYKAMMPLETDSDATAQSKVDTLISMIEADRQGRILGLGQAGFDVSGFQAKPDAGAWTDEKEEEMRRLREEVGSL